MTETSFPVIEELLVIFQKYKRECFTAENRAVLAVNLISPSRCKGKPVLHTHYTFDNATFYSIVN